MILRYDKVQYVKVSFLEFFPHYCMKHSDVMLFDNPPLVTVVLLQVKRNADSAGYKNIFSVNRY